MLHRGETKPPEVAELGCPWITAVSYTHLILFGVEIVTHSTRLGVSLPRFHAKTAFYWLSCEKIGRCELLFARCENTKRVKWLLSTLPIKKLCTSPAKVNTSPAKVNTSQTKVTYKNSIQSDVFCPQKFVFMLCPKKCSFTMCKILILDLNILERQAVNILIVLTETIWRHPGITIPMN